MVTMTAALTDACENLLPVLDNGNGLHQYSDTRSLTESKFYLRIVMQKPFQPAM